MEKCLLWLDGSHGPYLNMAIDELLLETDIRFALLGTGEKELEDFFVRLAERFPGRAAVKLEYNKSLAKKFYAGGDLFLMPSKSEPCGLAQMIASRYGTVPIVRETGGLYDTIQPYNREDGSGNGFSFANYNAHEMKDAVSRAGELYREKPDAWQALTETVMQKDFSWGASAGKYIALYREMTEAR